MKPPNKASAPLLMEARTAQNFHGQVISALGADIVSGRFAENDILPGDAQLTKEFGVSRTVLREAFKTLSAKGLIESKAKVGTRVLERARWNMFDSQVLAWLRHSGPSLSFLTSLSEVRMGLEPEAAALAAHRRSDAQAMALLAAVDAMGEAMSSTEAFVRRDLEFHRLVADASGNPFMRSITALVEAALLTSFTISSPVDQPNGAAEVVAVHREVAESIERREPDRSRSAMGRAIQQGLNRAQRKLDISR